MRENEGLPGRAWHTTEPEWSTDLRTDTDRTWHGMDRSDFRGALAVPIPSGTATLGVLACYCDTPETPDDLRTAVMAGIAAHIGEFLERRRAEQVTAELEQTRNEYITLVGHELRTPLTSIQSSTDVLRTDTDLTSEERDHMHEVMHRNAGRLHTLVNELLDVAATRTGRAPLQTQPVDLVELAKDVAKQARTDDTATIDINSQASVMVHADPARLRRVVEELLSNALTWAPRDSIVGININADHFTTELAVTNTGPRIADHERSRVFDLLFRTETAANSAVPGRGLGLTHARAVVEQHGGTLVLSEPDEAATTFTMRLPAHQGNA